MLKRPMIFFTNQKPISFVVCCVTIYLYTPLVNILKQSLQRCTHMGN